MLTIFLIVLGLVLLLIASLPRVSLPFNPGWPGLFCLALVWAMNHWPK